MDQNLYLAATTSDTDGIMKLRNKVDQVTSDGNSHTILHLVALSNQSKCIDAILKEFPHLLDKVNSRKETALHLSVSKGYSDVVNLLIKKSKALDSGMIDFLMKTRDLDHNVVRELDSDVADLFIRKYRSLEFENDDWVSAIDLIRKGNVDLDTALHLAVRNNHPNVVEVIVKADPSDRHAQNTNSETPLYMAVVGRYSDMVEIMLKSCRDPGYSGPQGRTILHAAIERRDTDFVILILREKTYLYDIADDKGRTAFHYAAYHNCGSILNFLLGKNGYFYGMSLNAELRRRDKKLKKSALHVAACQGHVSIVIDLMRFYVEHPIHVRVGDNLVNTATEVNDEDRNMLQLTANQNLKGDNLAYTIAEVDEEGQNILHMAADQKHKELVLSILKYCPDISLLLNKKDKNENTPLHLLVKSGCFARELIKHKDVDINAKNKDNFTPYDLLYFHDDIIADQLMIKSAFEDTEANKHWYNLFSTFWSSQKNTEIDDKEKNLAIPSKRRIKDAKFKVAKAKLMKDEVELYRGRTNTQIVVTALITTVTFTVGFTMPGGYHQSGEVDEGSAVLSKKKAFNIFMIADTIALVLSTASLFLYFISSMYQDPHEISKFNAASTGLNIVSVVAMMLTFITGTYVVLPSSPALAITVCVISCLFFLQVIFLMIKLRYDPIEKFKVCLSLLLLYGLFSQYLV